MLSNYLKLTLRNLRKAKGYTFISVGGLAIGLAVCLLVLLFVRHELSYDRFNDDADRIYRLAVSFGDFKFAALPASVAPYVAQHYPEVENFARLYKIGTTVRRGDVWAEEKRFFYADSSALSIFTFPLVAGDPAKALTEPGSVIVTESAARRIFDDPLPMGATLETNDGRTFQVTGVARDAPSNSHLKFDFLASYSTLDRPSSPLGNQGYTYLLLHDGASAASLGRKLDVLAAQDKETIREAFGWAINGMTFHLQSLTSIHLHSNLMGEAEPPGDPRYLYVFSLIALFILGIGAVNYMNLATARSAERAREVGVRKVLGARRGQLARQFLSESLLFGLLALILAITLVELLMPFFNEVTGKSLRTVELLDPLTMAMALGIVALIGVAAGSYPALYLSRFLPVHVLKRAVEKRGGSLWLRRGLVTLQFAASIALIASTLVVYRQLDYVDSKDLGYDTEQILSIPISGSLETQRDAFVQEMKALPGVERVSLASGNPLSGVETEAQVEGQRIPVRTMTVDSQYLPTMGMHLVEGRNFSDDLASDSSAIIVNETAARLFGIEDKVGEMLDQPLRGTTPEKLVGIVRDFHVASLREPIKATIIERDPSWYGALVVRMQPASRARTVGQIDALLKRLQPERPAHLQFLDDMLAQTYSKERRLAKLFGGFAGLAILIACMGLFGLAAFTAEQRTKEIGVRKVLGASITGIVVLISKEFVRLVVAAFVVAAPLAYFGMNRWLQDFAYRIDVSWTLLASAGLAVFVVALLTVSYQAVKAAVANPVKALRYE